MDFPFPSILHSRARSHQLNIKSRSYWLHKLLPSVLWENCTSFPQYNRWIKISRYTADQECSKNTVIHSFVLLSAILMRRVLSTWWRRSCKLCCFSCFAIKPCSFYLGHFSTFPFPAYITWGGNCIPVFPLLFPNLHHPESGALKHFVIFWGWSRETYTSYGVFDKSRLCWCERTGISPIYKHSENYKSWRSTICFNMQ